MIISASRRTDIPAFYSDWFFNRLKEGYVVVPNPFNPDYCSQVNLNPEVVDCIVFWTKNPFPLLNRLDELNNYKYYFQYTLNPYGIEIERNVGPLSERMRTFRELAAITGKDKIVWRYDPIIINKKYDIRFHTEMFDEMAFNLKDSTQKCMIGSIHQYKHVNKALRNLEIGLLTFEESKIVSESFSETGKKYNISIEACNELIDLTQFGIKQGQCVSRELIRKITGYNINVKKDKSQRPSCNCVESIDIGMYGSCPHGCIYCYANSSDKKVISSIGSHYIYSPKLIGDISGSDTIKIKKVKSLREDQGKLF